MATDFIKQTRYKRTLTESSLTDTLWDDTYLPRNRGIVRYLEDSLVGISYNELGDDVKKLVSHCRLQLKDIGVLTAVLHNGGMSNRQLLESNINTIEDMVPFMSDEEIEVLREPLTVYYQKQYELSHLAVGVAGGNSLQYFNANLNQLYFLYKSQSPLLDCILQDNANNIKMGYLGADELEPLADKQGILTFIRQTGEDIRYNEGYIQQIPYEYWVTDEDKLTVLRQHFMRNLELNPNYILRNGYLKLGVQGVMRLFINRYWDINPYLAKESKQVIDERLIGLIQRTKERLTSRGGNRDTDIQTRYTLLMTMVYLTVYGVGDYTTWIKELAYTG